MLLVVRQKMIINCVVINRPLNFKQLYAYNYILSELPKILITGIFQCSIDCLTNRKDRHCQFGSVLGAINQP